MSKSEHENLRADIAPTNKVQVAAIFEDKHEAQTTAEQLTANKGISPQQVTLIDGQDEKLSQKLEGSSEKIGKHMWNSHLVLGGIGLLVGLLFAFILVELGPALTQQNPLFTYIALISPGIFTGLFIAGLLGLRPDRSQIIQTVRHAVRRKKVALVINLEKSQSVSDVSQFLNNRSNTVVEAIR